MDSGTVVLDNDVTVVESGTVELDTDITVVESGTVVLDTDVGVVESVTVEVDIDAPAVATGDREVLSKVAVAEVGVDASSEVEDCVPETVVDDVSVMLSVEVTEVVLADWLEIGVDVVSVV